MKTSHVRTLLAGVLGGSAISVIRKVAHRHDGPKLFVYSRNLPES